MTRTTPAPRAPRAPRPPALAFLLAALAAVPAAVTGGAAPVAAQATPDARAVDRLFERWDRAGSPGCALGVARDGRTLHARGYGSANLDYGIPLSDSSVFYMASVSKQFAAAAVALAARQGKLSLDDDVRKFVPELPDYGTPITVRHLVHHTSGLRDYLGLMPLAGIRYEDVLTDPAMIALIARQKALNAPPGAEWSYTNSGYVLLAEIVRRTTGRSLREYADAELFAPLGMRETHFHDEPLHPIRNRVIGYDRAGEGEGEGEGFRINHLGNFDKVGDGGLYSSVRDVLRWSHAFDGERLVGAVPVAELVAPGTLADGKPTTYAFGLMVGRHGGRPVVEHSGGFMGFRTHLARYPAERLSVTVLYNVGDANPTALARSVAELYLGIGPRAAAVAKATPVRLPAAELERAAGTYRDPRSGGVVELSVRDGALGVSFGGAALPLEALGPARFRLAADAALEFELEAGAAGRPARLRQVRDGAVQSTMERVTWLALAPAELRAYAGTYWSEELGTTYTVAVEGERLTVRNPIRPAIPLRSPARDLFIGRAPGAGALELTFTRDASGAVTGFALGAGPRVRGIRFDRR